MFSLPSAVSYSFCDVTITPESQCLMTLLIIARMTDVLRVPQTLFTGSTYAHYCTFYTMKILHVSGSRVRFVVSSLV